MRLPNLSSGIGRAPAGGTRIHAGVSAALRIGGGGAGGLNATCTSDEGDICDCPGKCCLGGPTGCSCLRCPTAPTGPKSPGPTTAIF
jgi:hypothetical protein